MNTDPQNPTLDQIMSVVVGFYGRREEDEYKGLTVNHQRINGK
jgi:hypothetical protein